MGFRGYPCAMRPSSLAGLLCCLLLSASARARAVDPNAAVSDFWSWFAGPGAEPGAFKAPAMPCAKVHELVNQYSKSGKRFVSSDGQEYAYNFLIALGANGDPRLCRYTDGPTIPAEAMMPQRFPLSFASWLDAHDSDEAIRHAAMGYLNAASSTEDPVGTMIAERKKFWDLAMKAVLADPAQRARICKEIEPDNQGCPEQLQTRSLEELYAAGRRAPRVEKPAGPAVPRAAAAVGGPAAAPAAPGRALPAESGPR